MNRSVSVLLVRAACFAAAALVSVACDPAAEELEVATVGREILPDILSLGFNSLSVEPVPQPVGGHVLDQTAAIRLGKTFFWDVQAGSDGQVACATCHHAPGGVDSRTVNTVNPGLDGIFGSGGVTGPGQTYTPGDILNDDLIGSQGVARGIFVSFNPDPSIAAEDCTPVVDGVFGTNRRVEFRQAPSIFGAVFFRQLFWAGEANHEFNGLTIWGDNANNTLTCPPEQACTVVQNAPLASQATGPIANSIEMRCTGRPVNGPLGLAGKMLARPPLQFQRVSPTDSVLGAYANLAGPGLVCNGAACNYRDMIAEAFGAEMAANAENMFSIIWGESIQAYETTLIPDETPFDHFLEGNLRALTRQQLHGLSVFVNRGNCATCHAGPMLSDATKRFFDENGPLNSDGGDQGFHNIGLRNSDFDGGRGTFGPGGVPLTVSYSQFDDYGFKTPHLRNVKLSAPYFHGGTHLTLESVVETYDLGGDAPNNPQKSAEIFPLRLSAADKAALVDFMANALTDCRVEQKKAPFDHPELIVVNGPHLPPVGAEGLGSCP
jgi:cytochrome c peroxidase